MSGVAEPFHAEWVEDLLFQVFFEDLTQQLQTDVADVIVSYCN